MLISITRPKLSKVIAFVHERMDKQKNPLTTRSYSVANSAIKWVKFGTPELPDDCLQSEVVIPK